MKQFRVNITLRNNTFINSSPHQYKPTLNETAAYCCISLWGKVHPHSTLACLQLTVTCNQWENSYDVNRSNTTVEEKLVTCMEQFPATTFWIENLCLITVFHNCENTKPHSLKKTVNGLNEFIESIAHLAKPQTMFTWLDTICRSQSHFFCKTSNTFSFTKNTFCSVMHLGRKG